MKTQTTAKFAGLVLAALLGGGAALAPPASAQAPPDCDGPEAFTSVEYFVTGGADGDDLGPLAPTAGPGDEVGATWETTPGCEDQTAFFAAHPTVAPIFDAAEVQPLDDDATPDPEPLGEEGTILLVVPEGTAARPCAQLDFGTGAPLPEISPTSRYNSALFGLGGVNRLVDNGYTCDDDTEETTTTTGATTTTTTSTTTSTTAPPVTEPPHLDEETTTTVEAPPTTGEATTTTAGPNCAELGRVNVPRGDADYRTALDRDGDGYACDDDTSTASTLPITGPLSDLRDPRYLAMVSGWGMLAGAMIWGGLALHRRRANMAG